MLCLAYNPIWPPYQTCCASLEKGFASGFRDALRPLQQHTQASVQPTGRCQQTLDLLNPRVRKPGVSPNIFISNLPGKRRKDRSRPATFSQEDGTTYTRTPCFQQHNPPLDLRCTFSMTFNLPCLSRSQVLHVPSHPCHLRNNIINFESRAQKSSGPLCHGPHCFPHQPASSQSWPTHNNMDTAGIVFDGRVGLRKL